VWSEGLVLERGFLFISIDFILSNKNHNLQKFQNEIQSLCDLYESNYGKTDHIEDHVVNQVFNSL